MGHGWWWLGDPKSACLRARASAIMILTQFSQDILGWALNRPEPTKTWYQFSLQNKCRTEDPDGQNLGRSGKLSFFTIYKFWQSCGLVRQLSDLILKIASCRNPSSWETVQKSNLQYGWKISGHFWRLGPNVWLEISQIYIEYIKPISLEQGWVSSGRNVFLPGRLEETGK